MDKAARWWVFIYSTFKNTQLITFLFYILCALQWLFVELENTNFLPSIRNCFETIQTIETFFRSSPKRSDHVWNTSGIWRRKCYAIQRTILSHYYSIREIIFEIPIIGISINKEKSRHLWSEIKYAKLAVSLIMIDNIFFILWNDVKKYKQLMLV